MCGTDDEDDDDGRQQVFASDALRNQGDFFFSLDLVYERWTGHRVLWFDWRVKRQQVKVMAPVWVCVIVHVYVCTCMYVFKSAFLYLPVHMYILPFMLWY